MARWVRSSGEHVNIFRRVSTPSILNDINEGDLWADLSVSPPVLMKCTSLSPVTWVSVEGSGGGGGGESNTVSNIGSGGVGIFKQKTGVDLEFKKINSGSSKITITDDTGNNEIDIDVAQVNLDHGSIGGLSDDDHSQYHNDSRADIWFATKNVSGTNTGDQTSVVGITGTKAQFDTACSDGNFLYVGDVSTPNVFGTIAVSGQSDVVADSSTDILTLVAGSNITITTNATTDEITITGSGGGSGLTQPQVMAIASMGL